MNSAKWLSYLVDDIRHLPTTVSADDVLEKLQNLHLVANQHNLHVPLEYQAVYEGYAQYRNGELIPAMKQFFDCIALCTSAHQEYLLHFSYFNIGTIFGMLGDHLHASEFLTKAENIQNFQDDILYALIQNNIGDLLEQLDKNTEALEYFTKAISLVEALNQHEYSTLSYINVANVYIKLNKLSSALETLNHLKPLIQSNDRYLSFYHQAKGRYFQVQGQYDQAEQQFLAAIHAIKNCHHQYYQAEMTLDLCHILLKTHQLSRLDAYLDEGLNLAKQVGTDKLIDDFNDLLLSRMDEHSSFKDKQKNYELLLHSYQKARQSSRERETSYLQQIYQLNMDRLKLESTQDINSNLSMVNNIGQYISTCDNFKDIIGQLTNDLSRLFIIDTLAIAFYNPDKQQMHIEHYYDEGEVKQPFSLTFGDEASFLEYCATKNRPLYFNNMDADKKQQLLNGKANHEGNNSLMFAPISIDGKVKAVFTMQSIQCFAYQTYHYELFLQLATYMSIAIENQLNRKKLTKLSQTDHLTQLWNRQSLDIHFEDLMLNPPKLLSVLMFDIDCYKEFNDHYGHIKGDETLVGIANLISDFFGCVEAKVYRYGGDEFVVIVHSHNSDHVNNHIVRLQEALYQFNLPNEKSHCADRLSLSIGVAHIQQQTQKLTLSDCLHKADMALYQAKRMGRNRYVEQYYTDTSNNGL